jgi:hypothetical protein
MVWFLRPLKPALPSLYLVMRMSKVAFGHCCGLPPLILLPFATFWTFCLDHPRWPLFSYDGILALGRLSQRWLNQDLLTIKLDHAHVCREQVLIKLHLGTFCKFQSSFIYGRLNPSIENIAIIGSMTLIIMPFTICILFDLFR